MVRSSLRPVLAAAALMASTWMASALSAAAAAPSAAPTPAASAAAAPHAAAPASSTAARRKPAPAPVKLVDINSASKAELKTLPGIGDAEAENIIKHRPYLTKTELVTKKVLPTGPYLALKNKVVAMQKAPPTKAAKS